MHQEEVLLLDSVFDVVQLHIVGGTQLHNTNLDGTLIRNHDHRADLQLVVLDEEDV